MWFKSVGYFFLLMLTEGLTGFIGVIFAAVAWATYLDGREQGQQTGIGPLFTFTSAVLFDLLATLAFWFDPDPTRFTASIVFIILCWILSVLTMFVARGNTGREIATIKVGCLVMLAIGCIAVIYVTLF